MEAGSGIKATKGLSKIVTRIREGLQQIEKISAMIMHIADLQKRVSDLDKRLERCPGEACNHCGALEVRVDHIEDFGFADRMFLPKMPSVRIRGSLSRRPEIAALISI
jgi:hypothetical protein